MGNNGWIPVESACLTTLIDTDVNQNFGVENAFHIRLFEDDGSNASLATSLTGIAYVTYGMNRDVKVTPFATVTNYQELESKKLVITVDKVDITNKPFGKEFLRFFSKVKWANKDISRSEGASVG